MCDCARADVSVSRLQIDAAYAEKLGVNMKDLLISQPDSVSV